MTLLARVGLALAMFGAATPTSAQLDPLRFLKGARPNVILALDVSSRMLRNPAGDYYDPVVFERTAAPFEVPLDVGNHADRAYRRVYPALAWRQPGDGARAEASAVQIVGDRDAAYAGFAGRTRAGRVATAVRRVVSGNVSSARFGLVTSRQRAARIDTADWPTVAVRAPAADQPTDTGEASTWRTGIPVVDGPSAGGQGLVIAADSASSTADLLALMGLPAGQPGSLLPAGFDTEGALDAPLGLLLDDARLEARRLIAADLSCANTVVVLIGGGGDPSLGLASFADRAAAFLDVAGRRVPLHIIGLAPAAAEASQLRLAAERSGGRYIEISREVIDRVPPNEPVPELVSAVNLAVHHAFANFADINAPPSLLRPYGSSSQYQTASPAVGTVNLENGVDAGGRLLPDTRVVGPGGGVIPQRSNVMFTSGFELPGFLGRVSAYRVYRPVPDPTRPTGYRFTADGTRLWTAQTPPASVRNIFTVLPGGAVVAFRAENAPLLAPYLRHGDPAGLIDRVRSLPLGPVVNSTPALLEPPSAAFADIEYAAFAQANRRRRAVLFVGADDGMMHAIDARTGIEAWAVIPFNLLPKLRLLEDGWPVDSFPFLVDGSPRLADVKVGNAWRTHLLFGQGPGGTFYQAFDVTLDDIATSVPPDADAAAPLLAWFARSDRIPFAWSFPSYAHFDPALGAYGDTSTSASALEKTVGESWSTPVVGRTGSGRFVAIVGSGPLAASRERQSNRGGVRAGTTLYLLAVDSGLPLDARDVGSDGEGEEADGCPVSGCLRAKNAIGADPVATGPAGESQVSRVYAGDLDGRLWRFDLADAAGPPRFAGQPRLLLSVGGDQPVFGSIALLAGTAGQTYLFVATGSDLLPRAAGMPPYRLLALSESAAGVGQRFERLLQSAGDGVGMEAVAGPPTVAGGVAFFATTTRVGVGRCQPDQACLYAVTVSGGAAYDTNGDERRDEADTAVVARLGRGRATAPTVKDGHLFLATGDRVQLFGDPESFNGGPDFLGIRLVSWREVR